MRISPHRVSSIPAFFALEAEERIAYQLAELGLQLQKLGRLDAYKQVIDVRNDLLAALDCEHPKAKKNIPTRRPTVVTSNQTIIACVRPKQQGLKVRDHAR